MKIILAAILFTIVFYSIGKIGYIINFIKGLTPTQGTLYGFMWFFSILFINLILIAYTIGYYYYAKKHSYGPSGPKGYPGKVGEETECLICDNQPSMK